jgi:hypothetical protein
LKGFHLSLRTNFAPQSSLLESEAATVLLIRSVEEADENAFSDETLNKGLKVAGDFDPDDPASWFLRRAAWLSGRLSASYLLIPKMVHVVDRANPLVWTLALVIGIASNHFGPTGKIHVLFNPIMALVTWNVLLYSLLGVRTIRNLLKRRTPDPHSASKISASASTFPEPGLFLAHNEPGNSRAKPSSFKRFFTFLLQRFFIPTLWTRWEIWKIKGEVAKNTANTVSQVAHRFWVYWLVAAREITILRFERVFHLGAIGLTTGAIAGMYIRGLFLDYNVVWRSTFVRSEETITLFLKLVLGPAAWLLGVNLSDHVDVARLMSSSGAPAALWIHLYAITAAALILVPRSILYVSESIRLKKLAANIPINFTDEYFWSRVRSWRRSKKNDVLKDIRAVVLSEYTKLADNVATFVCKELYDTAVATELDHFRQSGGKIKEVEDKILRASKEFVPKLNDYVDMEVERSEESLTEAVKRILGKQLAIGIGVDLGLAGTIEHAPDQAATNLATSMGEGFTGTVSVAVSTAMALALGTVSGGFGKALGIAIVVSLFHTTGPFAFVIGAIGGLLIGAGAWWFGRERMAKTIKEVKIPASVVKTVLWKTRMDRILADGRAKTRESVKAKVVGVLQPLSEKVAEEIWIRLEPLTAVK